MTGARITEMPVSHYPRKFGRAYYGLERTVKVLLDLLTVKFLGLLNIRDFYEVYTDPKWRHGLRRTPLGAVDSTSRIIAILSEGGEGEGEGD